MAVGTIVVIILGILILIGLLVFWNYQTGIFSDFLENIQGKTNVDSIVTACNTQQSQQAVYEYCCVKKQVKYTNEENKIVEEELTCLEISEKSFTSNRIQKLNCGDVEC